MVKYTIFLYLILFSFDTKAQTTEISCATEDGATSVNGNTSCSISGAYANINHTIGTGENKRLYVIGTPAAGVRTFQISTQDNTRKHQLILKDKMLTEDDAPLADKSPIFVQIRSDAVFHPPETTVTPYVTSDAPSYVIMAHSLEGLDASVRGFMGTRGKDASEKCAERIQAGFTGNTTVDNTIRSLFNARCIGDAGPYPESFFSFTPSPCPPENRRNKCDNEDLRMITRVAEQDKVDMCSGGTTHVPSMDGAATVLSVPYKRGHDFLICARSIRLIKRVGETCESGISQTVEYNTSNCSNFTSRISASFELGADLVWEIPSGIRYHSSNPSADGIYDDYSYQRVAAGEVETGVPKNFRLAQKITSNPINFFNYFDSGCISGYPDVSNTSCSKYYAPVNFTRKWIFTPSFWLDRGRVVSYRFKGSTTTRARIVPLSCDVAKKQPITLNSCSSTEKYTSQSYCVLPNSTNIGFTNMHYLDFIKEYRKVILWPSIAHYPMSIKPAFSMSFFICTQSGCLLPTDRNIGPVNYSFLDTTYTPRSETVPSAQMNSKSGKITLLTYDSSSEIYSDFTQAPHQRNGIADINFSQVRHCSKVTHNPEFNQYKDFQIILQRVMYKPIQYTESSISLPNDIYPLSPSTPTPERLVLWKKISPGAMELLYRLDSIP